MKSNLKTTGIFLFFIFLLISCGGNNLRANNSEDANTPQKKTKTLQENTNTPHWLNELITQFEKSPPQNPPAKIIQYNYNGALVYYLTPKCCDFWSNLYDANGETICHPDGGFTGKGDGKCPDFFAKRTGGLTIWQDERGSSIK